MPKDSLASGAKSATFGPAVGISQARWDAIWADDTEPFTVDLRSVPVTKPEDAAGIEYRISKKKRK